MAAQLENIDPEATDDDEEDALPDTDTVEESHEALRAEPARWQGRQDEVHIRLEVDDGKGATTLEARISRLCIAQRCPKPQPEVQLIGFTSLGAPRCKA